MKTILFFIVSIIMFYSGTELRAINVSKHVIEVRQPDGSLLKLTIVGDEFFHYAMTEDGRLVTPQKDGYYYYAYFANDGTLRSENRRVGQSIATRTFGNRPPLPQSAIEKASAQRSAMGRSSLIGKGFPTTGRPKSLVVLVNFSDLAFSTPSPKSYFTALLNEKGYSANGATGSARDYFYDNSNGIFDPEFIVVGPIKLPNDMATYAQDPRLLVIDACTLVKYYNTQLSDFDENNDGILDNIFIYFAGHNKAENFGPNEIWPGEGAMNNNTIIDGVKIGSYAYSSEYRGSKTTVDKLCTIGTFCHEFGHVLGLPDFYDTDQDQGGVNTQNLYNFSLMCNGNGINNGRTPPQLTAIEKTIIGWMTPDVLTSSGEYELLPIKTNHAYRINSSNTNEYFILEYREPTAWDRFINAEGMLVYHVDQSNNKIGHSTAGELWKLNSINNNNNHPCCYIVPASSTDNSWGEMTFPGTQNITSYTPTGWNGRKIGYDLRNIRNDGDKITFTLDVKSTTSISGTISSNTNKKLSEVILILEDQDNPHKPLYMIENNSDGSYIFNELPLGNYLLIAEKVGYQSWSQSIKLSHSEEVMNILLANNNTIGSVELKYHNGIPRAMGVDRSGGVYWEAKDLIDYVGQTLNEVRGYTLAAGSMELIIQFSDKEVYTKQVTNTTAQGETVINLKDANLKIPANESMLIGFRMQGDVQPLALDNQSDSATENGQMVEWSGMGWWPSTLNGVWMISVHMDNSMQIPANTLILSAKQMDIGLNGETFQLKAIVKPTNATTKQVTWISEDPTIAQVDSNGIVRGIASGSTLISATIQGSKLTASCVVNVLTAEQAIVRVSSDQRDAEINWERAVESSSYVLKWRKKDDTEFVSQVYKGSSTILKGLQPNSEYEIQLMASNSICGITRTFRTDRLGSNYAALKLKGEYLASETIVLKVTNVQDDIVEIIWIIDGKIHHEASCKLTKGQHQIRAEVTTSQGTEILTRSINIKNK